MNIEKGMEGEVEFSGFVTNFFVAVVAEETGVAGFWWHQVKTQGHVCTSGLGCVEQQSLFPGLQGFVLISRWFE